MHDPLTTLAIKHATDKWGVHRYTPHYERFFSPVRYDPMTLLEIGIGGSEDPDKGGESLRMWKEYFPHSHIIGLDIFDKSAFAEERITTYQGCQTDEHLLARLHREAGSLDIIIDDGSHINAHVIRSFEILFPLLAPHGLYIVEDLQTSYWSRFGGNSFNTRRHTTSMNYFKHLLDSLNYTERENPWYRPTYFDRHIIGMHFFHNLVFIQKGDNSDTMGMLEREQQRSLWSKYRLYLKRRILLAYRVVRPY